MPAVHAPTFEFHEVADVSALSAAVAHAFFSAVTGALAERGRASIVITGGSTPRAYYPALAALPLPWSRVDLTLSDERWVPLTHPDSNERLVRELLMVGAASAARFVPLTNDAPSAAAGAARTAARLSTMPHPYDLVLLGFGADMHIASLFPTADVFDAGVDPNNDAACLAVAPPVGVAPALPRISLTLRELLASRRIVIAARGEDKRFALRAALAQAAPYRTPIALLAERATQPVEFLWCP